MAKLIILGTSNAIPTEDHDNTHMILVGNENTVLIDCVNNPIVRLRKIGLAFDDLTDLILTHFHPDHVSGVPSLLMNMWLLGRKKQLDIYGLEYTLDRMEMLMEFYSWDEWPSFYPVKFHRLTGEPHEAVLETEEFKITSSPVQHMLPAIGLRMDFTQSEKSLAYSCDTQPCEQVVGLASGADVLIHEATGEGIGHSSAAQAGSIARRAEVGKLFLIHYQTYQNDPSNLVPEAEATFGGSVDLAYDFMELEF